MKLFRAVAVLTLPAALLGACGSQSHAERMAATARSVAGGVAAPSAGASSTAARPPAAARRRVSRAPVVRAPGQVGSNWTPVATVAGHVAAWTARAQGVTFLRFDQQLLVLHLHSGSAYPGGGPWTYGDRIEPSELHRIVAAFNGGFKFNVPGNGFFADGRAPVPLRSGLASIVTYRSGVTAIGAWDEGVPAAGQRIQSVRQNLHLLVDRGTVAATATGCPLTCWGSTLGGGVSVPRSALAITANGNLLWGAGETLTPAALGHALVAAGAVRAVELDINPAWVAAYLYVHQSSGPNAVPVIPGQNGIAGRLLAPYSRDFFTIVSK